LRQLKGHSRIDPVPLKTLPAQVDINLVRNIGTKLEPGELVRQVDLQFVNVSPEIVAVFSVAVFKSRPVAEIKRTPSAFKCDVQVRPALPDPAAIALFDIDLLVIESKVYPVRKTLVRKAQVRMVIIKMTCICDFALRIIIGICATLSSFLRVRHTSKPSIIGSIISKIIRSGLSFPASLIPSSPFNAETVSYPSCLRL